MQSFVDSSSSEIMCICETWFTEVPAYLSNAWEVFHQFWSPAVKTKAAGRGSGGFVMLSRKSECDCEIIDVSKWWICCKVSIFDLLLVIVSVYFTPEDDISCVTELLDNALEDIRAKNEDDIIIVGGDFNAWVAELNCWPEDAPLGPLLFPLRSSLHKKENARGL